MLDKILGGLSGVIGIANGLNSLFDGDSMSSKEMMDYQAAQERSNMRLQAELNSPARIAKEYAKAGFNPYVTMGSGSGSSGGQSSLGAVAMPESGYNLVNSQQGVLFADTLAKLAGAYKSSKEGSVVREVAGSQVAKNAAEADKLRSEQALNDIAKKFEETFGAEKRSKENRLLEAKIQETYQNANTLMAQGNLLEAEQVVKQLESIIQNELIKQSEYNTRMLGIRLQQYPQELSQTLKTLKAQESEAYAGAREKLASAEYQEFMNKVYNDKSVRDSLVSQLKTAAEQAKSTKKLTDAQVKQVEFAAEQLKKATENFEIQMWAGIINQTINTAANAIGEFTKFGLAKKFLSSPSSSSLSDGRGYMMQDGVLMLNPVR